MRIRQATEQDIDEVKKVSDSLQVSRDQKGWEKATSGLFEYPKTREELLKALNPHFIVAELEKTEVRGYSLGYDNEFFRTNYGNTDYTEWRFILDNIKGSYLYIDQLGVSRPETLSAGLIAINLVNKTIESAQKKGLDKVVTLVCVEPLPNKRSLALMRRRGLQRFGSVPIENGVVLDAYKLNLPPQ